MLVAGSVKDVARRLGADLCGIAPVERFAAAPEGFHPRDILPSCESVVAIACRFPASTLKATTNSPYTLVRSRLVDRVDGICCALAIEMEDAGACAVPIPSAEPYDFWDGGRRHGRGILSLKHAAELAGLGRIGKNTLLINTRYGNMVWLGAVLVDHALDGDPLADYDPCISGCSRCLDACPQGALDGTTIDQASCRERSTAVTEGGGWVLSCNTCRRVCPNRLGMR